MKLEYILEIEYKQRKLYKSFNDISEVRKYLEKYLNKKGYNIHFFQEINSMFVSEDLNLFITLTKWIISDRKTTYENVPVMEIF